MNTHLTICNRSGSVEHYYHFLLGFLAPLLTEKDRLELAGDGLLLVRSCALLDRHLLALRLPELRIIKRGMHEAMTRSSACGTGYAPLRFVRIDGHDDPERYGEADFKAFADILFSRYAAEIARARNGIESRFRGRDPRVVLIGRQPAHAYYNSPLSERKTAGSQRRSIPNLEAIAHALLAHNVNLLTDFMEGTSLWHQIALFESADVIIAQHGAALANLVFARPSTRVIEVMPHDNDAKLAKNHFGRLARHMGQCHQFVRQDSSHAPVAPAAILDLL